MAEDQVGVISSGKPRKGRKAVTSVVVLCVLAAAAVLQFSSAARRAVFGTPDRSKQLAALITRTVDRDHTDGVTTTRASCRREKDGSTYGCVAVVTSPALGVYRERWTGMDRGNELTARQDGGDKQIGGPTLPAPAATCAQLDGNGALISKFDAAAAVASNNQILPASQLKQRAYEIELAGCLAAHSHSFRPWSEVVAALATAA